MINTCAFLLSALSRQSRLGSTSFNAFMMLVCVIAAWPYASLAKGADRPEANAAQLLSAAAPKRPFSVDDLLGLRRSSPFPQDHQISPDGTSLAMSLGRSLRGDRNFSIDQSRLHYDIWVQLTKHDTPENITRGDQDSSGWFRPRWSPDGRKLAMFGTRGASLGVWIWEKGNGRLARASTREVDVNTPLEWLDNSHLIYGLQPGGIKEWGLFPDAASTARKAWDAAAKGKLSVSVIGLGAPSEPATSLVVLDLDKQRVTEIGTGAVNPTVDQSGRRVAYFSRIPSSVVETEGWAETERSPKYNMKVVDVSGRLVWSQDGMAYGPRVRSLAWNPNGDKVAFLSLADDRQSILLKMVDLEGDRPRTVTYGGMGSIDRFRWIGNGELLLSATRLSERLDNTPPRRDLWLLDANGQSRNLTARWTTAPIQIHQLGSRRIVGLVDGEIIEISKAGSRRTLTNHFEPKIKELMDLPRADRRLPSSLLFQTASRKAGNKYYVLDEALRIIRLTGPPGDPVALAFSDISKNAVMVKKSDEGTMLWRASTAGKPHPLLAANDWLKDVEAPRFKKIEYISLKGEKLVGWIMLPYGYVEGRRYPTIAWVYHGQLYNNESDLLGQTLQATQELPMMYHLQIASASGYAVLFPSMPTATERTPEPLFDLTNGVLPAVNQSVSLGISDPTRLFLFGHSYGGYTVSGLITQTHIFKAAAASAGFSDLLSTFGTFNSIDRYYDFLQRKFNQANWTELGQAQMNGPPLGSLERYIRNSPIAHLDKVETPLLLAHGDFDAAVPIQQAEEMFTGLFRLGKQVQFARYFGDGHVLQGPENIKDLWARVFTWFDTYGDIDRDQGGRIIFDGQAARRRLGNVAFKSVDDWLGLWSKTSPYVDEGWHLSAAARRPLP